MLNFSTTQVKLWALAFVAVGSLVLAAMGSLKSLMTGPESRAQFVQTTRQALIEGGFARVRERVDAGVLPAVMVGLVGGGLAASLSTPQANGQTSAPLLPKGRGDLYY